MRCVNFCLHSVDLHISEAIVDLGANIVEVLSHLDVSDVRVFELHLCQI